MPQRLEDGLPLARLLPPVLGPVGRAIESPAPDHIPDQLWDLPAVEEEDLFFVVEESSCGDHRAELSHLVPEVGVVEVLAVEVVVLYEREDLAGEADELVELVLLGPAEQRLVLARDSLPLGDDPCHVAVDVLSALALWM